MTKGEAIKYLQQLYPNDGHCWLDEQRIGAIGMAIKALQEEPVSDTQSPVVFYGLTGSVGNTKEEPVSEDLEYASEKYACRFSSSKYGHDKVKDSFIAGAKWQKEQFEKNRLAACDKQTEEEAEIESDFVMNIIKNEHRQPTFDDAIKYGMRLQKEQIRAKAEKVELSNASFAPLSSGNYKAGDKLLIIKEENL